MSTYYASFNDHQKAKNALVELVRGGVRPDDASLLLPGDGSAESTKLVGGNTFGDVTNGPGEDAANWIDPSLPIRGLDTSDKAFTGDSVDQMDDSQEEAEDMGYLPLDRTQGSLTVGSDAEFTEPTNGDEMEDQNADGLEELIVPGFGLVFGSGALATAALGRGPIEERIKAFLIDDGVPEVAADDLLAALHGGQAVLGIVATPGEIDEPTVEAIAMRHGGTDHGLFDAPRFYDREAYPA